MAFCGQLSELRRTPGVSRSTLLADAERRRVRDRRPASVPGGAREAYGRLRTVSLTDRWMRMACGPCSTRIARALDLKIRHYSATFTTQKWMGSGVASGAGVPDGRPEGGGRIPSVGRS